MISAEEAATLSTNNKSITRILENIEEVIKKEACNGSFTAYIEKMENPTLAATAATKLRDLGYSVTFVDSPYSSSTSLSIAW